MIPGLVSNCWKVQLESGEPLEALIETAAERGYRAVELRQTCLGRFESRDGCVPDARALPELPESFPGIQFNLALAFPFLATGPTRDDSLFHAGLDAAAALAGRFAAHLRLVDLETSDDAMDAAGGESVADSLSALNDRAEQTGVLLSVEHAKQSWTRFRTVFERVRNEPDAAPTLRLCYDPANLLLQPDAVDPAQVTQALDADELSMVHFKQCTGGVFLDTVCDGDIDWRRQVEGLQGIGFDGPALFEIHSTHEIRQKPCCQPRVSVGAGVADWSARLTGWTPRS